MDVGHSKHLRIIGRPLMYSPASISEVSRATHRRERVRRAGVLGARGAVRVREAGLGFGRIAASQIEAPEVVANLV